MREQGAIVTGVLALLCASACRPPSGPIEAPAEPPTFEPELGDESESRSAPSSPPAPAQVRVASWNLHRLGQGHKNLDAVAEVMAAYDLVAIQELMTKDAAEALVDELPGFAVLYTDSPRPLEGRYREYYAFFYRTERFEPVFNSYVPDPDDRFVREPFVGCFATRGDDHDLCFVNVHIVFGDKVAQRKAEILALDDALRWAQQARDDAHWVVLGDYNRPVDDGDRDDEPEAEWAELLDRQRLVRPLVLTAPDQATTITKDHYASSYDHIFVSTELAGRVRAAGVSDVVAEHCEMNFARCHDELSDHAPVFVELTLDEAEASPANGRTTETGVD